MFLHILTYIQMSVANWRTNFRWIYSKESSWENGQGNGTELCRILVWLPAFHLFLLFPAAELIQHLFLHSHWLKRNSFPQADRPYNGLVLRHQVQQFQELVTRAILVFISAVGWWKHHEFKH